MAKLVVLSEGLTGRSYELKVDKTTIGRVEDNAFPIAEPSVSSHHCEILLRGKDVVVKDLNSTNGTFINGEQVTEAVIKPGQILRLGQVEIRLETGEPPGPGKKVLDQTIVIPQGVRINELEGGTRSVNFETDSPFAKKSNKANKIFLVIGVVLGLVIFALIAVAFKRFQNMK